MALKQIPVLVDGVWLTFSNEDWAAVTKPYGLKKTGWRQNDNLFTLLLGILGTASTALQVTSATNNVVIGLGNKTIVTDAARPIPLGMPCFAFDGANPANFIFGTVSANAQTAGGNLTIAVTLTGGAGTPASWVIQPCGPRGATGATYLTAAGVKTANYQMQVDENAVADCRTGRNLSFTAPPNMTAQQKFVIDLIGSGTLTILRNATAPQVQLFRGLAEDAVISAGDENKSMRITITWIDNTFGFAVATAT